MIKSGLTNAQYLFEEEITSLALYDQGLLIGTVSGEVSRLSDLTNKEKTFVTSLLGKVNCIYGRNNIAAIVGFQEEVKVIQDNTEKTLNINRGSIILTVTISPDSVHIAAIAQDGHVYVFSNHELKKKMLITKKKIAENSLEQYICEFSPNSKKLGLPGDLIFSYLGLTKLEYESTGICCKNNISIIKWPKDNIVILATIDNSINVYNIDSESSLYSFQATGLVWDFLLIDTKIVALTNKEETFVGVSLETNEFNDTKSKDSEDKAVINEEKDLFERVFGVFPQDPIVPVTDDKAYSVLFRSTLGTILSREFNSGSNRISCIEIEFDDIGFHSNISIPNTEDFVLAFMNEKGVLLASQSSEVGLEDFVSDMKTSKIYFQGFNLTISWSISLPSQEIPESLCISTICAIFTSLNYIRLYNLGGLQTHVLSMTGPVVSLSSHQSTLAVIYHSAAPVMRCQSLTVEFWYTDEFSFKSEAECFKEEFKLALTPESNLIWTGFSDTGNFFTVDSADIVRCLWKRAMNWVPVCTLEDYTRVVGVTDEAVLINQNEKPTLIDSVEFSFPLCKSKLNTFEQQTMFETLKVENNKVFDRHKKAIELDKIMFMKYMESLEAGDSDTAFALAIQAYQEKTKLLCIKYANGIKAFGIEANLAKYFDINLPSRLARPERIMTEPPVADKPAELKSSNSDLAKENVTEKSENLKPLNNPFPKANGEKKTIFEELSSSSKRKPEPQNPTKKVKK